MNDPPASRQRDGQTDDMRSQDRALHYSASRGKNSPLSRGRTDYFAASVTYLFAVFKSAFAARCMPGLLFRVSHFHSLWTLTYDLDLQTWHWYGQEKPPCQVDTNTRRMPTALLGGNALYCR